MWLYGASESSVRLIPVKRIHIVLCIEEASFCHAF